jgi:hypothetical protein
VVDVVGADRIEVIEGGAGPGLDADAADGDAAAIL